MPRDKEILREEVEDLLNELPGQFDVILEEYFAGTKLSIEQSAMLSFVGKMTVNEFLYEHVAGEPGRRHQLVLAATKLLAFNGSRASIRLGLMLNAYYAISALPPKSLL